MSDNGGKSGSVIDRLIEYTAIIFVSVIAAAAITATLWALGGFIVADNWDTRNYMTFATGTSTVLLVGVTFWYSLQTRRLAENAEKARREEERQRKKEKQEKRNSLRVALKKEIEVADDFDKLLEDPSEIISQVQTPSLQTVYKQNADKIGQLTEPEIEAVMNYYRELTLLEDVFISKREGGDVPGLTDQIEVLIETQKEAVKALEEKMDESSESKVTENDVKQREKSKV